MSETPNNEELLHLIREYGSACEDSGYFSDDSSEQDAAYLRKEAIFQEIKKALNGNQA